MINALWIDNDKDREEMVRVLNKSPKSLKVVFVLVDKYKEELSKIESNNYDLILIDFYMKDAQNIFQGASMATICREHNKKTPIVLLSGELTKLKSTEDANLCRVSEAIIDLNQALDSSFIIAFANSYKTIYEMKIDKSEDILGLLKAPNLIKDMLEQVLPKEYIGNSEIQKRMLGRWIIDVLLVNPGFLYDEEHLSAHLGVKNTSFIKIKKEFVTCKYVGVFADKKELWWVSAVDSKLLNTKSVKQLNPMYVADIVPTIFKGKLITTDFVNCVVCGGKSPNILARDEDNESLRPVHFSCSKEDKKRSAPMFFDNPRMFKKD